MVAVTYQIMISVILLRYFNIITSFETSYGINMKDAVIGESIAKRFNLRLCILTYYSEIM